MVVHASVGAPEGVGTGGDGIGVDGDLVDGCADMVGQISFGVVGVHLEGKAAGDVGDNGGGLVGVPRAAGEEVERGDVARADVEAEAAMVLATEGVGDGDGGAGRDGREIDRVAGVVPAGDAVAAGRAGVGGEVDAVARSVFGFEVGVGEGECRCHRKKDDRQECRQCIAPCAPPARLHAPLPPCAACAFDRWGIL